MSEANEQACGESIANLCSAPARKGAAIGTDVQPTAGAQIAEWLQEIEIDIADYNKGGFWNVSHQEYQEVLLNNRLRLRRILDAINAST